MLFSDFSDNSENVRNTYLYVETYNDQWHFREV